LSTEHTKRVDYDITTLKAISDHVLVKTSI
jgi:predicted amino acid racemase